MSKAFHEARYIKTWKSEIDKSRTAEAILDKIEDRCNVFSVEINIDDVEFDWSWTDYVSGIDSINPVSDNGRIRYMVSGLAVRDLGNLFASEWNNVDCIIKKSTNSDGFYHEWVDIIVDSDDDKISVNGKRIAKTSKLEGTTGLNGKTIYRVDVQTDDPQSSVEFAVEIGSSNGSRVTFCIEIEIVGSNQIEL